MVERTYRITVRISVDERREWEAEALERRMDMSNWVRFVVNEHVKELAIRQAEAAARDPVAQAIAKAKAREAAKDAVKKAKEAKEAAELQAAIDDVKTMT
jgi:hypothetical protein